MMLQASTDAMQELEATRERTEQVAEDERRWKDGM